MNAKFLKEFKQKMIDELIKRQFAKLEYAAYIFSAKEKSSGYYLLTAEKSAITPKFKNKNDWPIPTHYDSSFHGLRISSQSYMKYFLNRGGALFRFKSILNEHKLLGGTPFLSDEQVTSWQDRSVISGGYKLKNENLIVFLVMQTEDETNENDLKWVNFYNVFKKVEDFFHIQFLFPKESLRTIEKRIRLNEWEDINNFVNDVDMARGKSTYLRQVYYDTFINIMTRFPRLTIDNHKKLMFLNQEFEKNQKHLFKSQTYRDHYLHQIYVYFLGAAILNTFHEDFNHDLIDHFNNAYKEIPKAAYKNLDDIMLVWFLASMFHDIAYPIELSEDWISKSIRLFLAPNHQKEKEKLSISLNFDKEEEDNVFLMGIETLTALIDRLHFRESFDLKGDNGNRDLGGLAGKLKTRFKEREHGLLSALILLNNLEDQTELHGFVFPAVEAIALHQWIPSDTLPKIAYKKDPAAFLLILCDLIHDWSRYNFEEIEQTANFALNPCFLENITNGEREIIFDIRVKTPPPNGEEFLNKLVKRKCSNISEVFECITFLPDYDIVIKIIRNDQPPIAFRLSDYQS